MRLYIFDVSEDTRTIFYGHRISGRHLLISLSWLVYNVSPSSASARHRFCPMGVLRLLWCSVLSLSGRCGSLLSATW